MIEYESLAPMEFGAISQLLERDVSSIVFFNTFPRMDRFFTQAYEQAYDLQIF
jgi:hypothetical protein